MPEPDQSDTTRQETTVADEYDVAKCLGLDAPGYILSRFAEALPAEIIQADRRGSDLTDYGRARLTEATHDEVLEAFDSGCLGDYTLIRRAQADHATALGLASSVQNLDLGSS